MRERLPEMGFVALTIVLFTFLVLLFLMRVQDNYNSYRIGYQLNELAKSYEDVESDNFKLQLIYATLTDSDRIIEIAKKELGMHKSVPMDLINVPSGVTKLKN